MDIRLFLDSSSMTTLVTTGPPTLMEVPRTGFTQADCTVPAPTTISGRFINGLDWK